MTKPAPDPAKDCPRCYHFSHTEGDREVLQRKAKVYPPIDQGLALDVLTKAFPRAYGVKSGG